MCNKATDVKFCEYAAVAVEGKDCAKLGLVTPTHFCVVSPTRCTDTSYSFRGRDCRVTDYEALREEEGECSPGTPTFVQ
jgi:hypothetical protein